MIQQFFDDQWSKGVFSNSDIAQMKVAAREVKAGVEGNREIEVVNKGLLAFLQRLSQFKVYE